MPSVCRSCIIYGVFSIILSANVAEAQICYVPNPAHHEEATIRVDKLDGTDCSATNQTPVAATNTTASSATNNTDGGYIRVSANTDNYRLHAIPTIQGACEMRYWAPQCDNLYLTDGYGIGYTEQRINGSVVNNLTTSYSAHQTYDSTVPTDTQLGPGWHATTAGHYTYDTTTMAIPGNCSFPSSFTSGVITFTALGCGPNFNYDGYGNIRHVPSSTVYVYVPSSMSGAYTAVDDAINDWNSGTNYNAAYLQRTTSPCSGSTCVEVAQSSLTAGTCATAYVPTDATSNGVANGTSVITLTTGSGPSDPDRWTNANSTVLRRTLAHELGHTLGMGHPNQQTGCSTVDDSAMMTDILPDCHSSTTGYQPTTSDTLPTEQTVYAGGSTAKCGF